MKESDKIVDEIMGIIDYSNEPLETKEIELRLSSISRTKIFYRLKELRGDGIIRGKMIGAGKGTWIWWRKDAFGASIIDG